MAQAKKGRLKSNPRASMRVARQEYENGKTMVSIFLTAIAGVETGDGLEVICDEHLELGSFHGCQMKGILKIWTESPLREQNKRMRDQLERQMKTAAIAKAVVRKEVEREFLDEYSDAAPVKL